MEYGNDSLVGQKKTQYSDRAAKQLAEDVFASDRTNHELNHSVAPEFKSKSERKTKNKKSPAGQATLSRKDREVHLQDRWSIVDIPPAQQNNIYGPFILDYYEAGSLSLRDYIRRSYLPWKQIPGIPREVMEEKLKALLDRTKGQGTIGYLDWAPLPLPQEVVYRERARGETGLMFEDLVGYVGAKKMDEEVQKEEIEKLADACRRKERELEGLREELREKEKAMGE